MSIAETPHRNDPNTIQRRRRFSRRLCHGLAVVVAAVAGTVPALAADQVRFRTNWFPQAEHGGWYQADREGTFEKYGLDVVEEEIRLHG